MPGFAGKVLDAGDTFFFGLVGQHWLADHVGKEGALLCQSGYTANLGLIQVIADPETPVYLDSLAHMSLWEGVRAAGAPAHSFRHNDPEHQERVIKFNELLANCSIYSTALDITDAANQLAAEGYPVDTDDLATITPYIQHTIRRMGDLVLNLAPPQEMPVTRLDLEPRVLFAART